MKEEEDSVKQESRRKLWREWNAQKCGICGEPLGAHHEFITEAGAEKVRKLVEKAG